MSMTLLVKASYLVAATLFLLGLQRMASPRTARSGIHWAGAGMLIATVATFFLPGLHNIALMLAALALLKRRRIALEDGVLVVAATLYTRKTAVTALDLAQARIASLDEHTEFRTGMKTNGYALPGFQAGHFRLRNRAKAFCLLTTQQRVLILPQRDGAFLLLSPERPQALLDALRTANTSS